MEIWKNGSWCSSTGVLQKWSKLFSVLSMHVGSFVLHDQFSLWRQVKKNNKSIVQKLAEKQYHNPNSTELHPILYEFMVDYCSYTHNLSSCEIKAWKKFRPERAWTNPWPLRYWCSALPRSHGFESCSGLNFFPGFNFTTALVVCITAMINYKFISFFTVQIYDLSYIHLHSIL